jgi:hypothetical protein
MVVKGAATTVELGMLIYNVDGVEASAELKVQLLPRAASVPDMIEVGPSEIPVLTSIKGLPEAANRFALHFTNRAGTHLAAPPGRRSASTSSTATRARRTR